MEQKKLRHQQKIKDKIVLSGDLVDQLLQKKGIKDSDISFYFIVCAYSDEQNNFRLSIMELTRILNLTASAVNAKLKRLKNIGLIQPEFRVQTKTKQILCFKAQSKARRYMEKNGGHFRTTQYKVMDSVQGGLDG